MLYKFKSKETADLIMLATHARQILALIGKEPTAQGVVLADEMPKAIQRLQDAVHAEAEAAKAQQMAKENGSTNEESEADMWSDTSSERVSLKQRTAPFIEMLKRAQAADVKVVWGV